MYETDVNHEAQRTLNPAEYIYDQSSLNAYQTGRLFRQAIDIAMSKGRSWPVNEDAQDALNALNKDLITPGMEARATMLKGIFEDDFDPNATPAMSLDCKNAGEFMAAIAGMYSTGGLLGSNERKEKLSGVEQLDSPTLEDILGIIDEAAASQEYSADGQLTDHARKLLTAIPSIGGLQQGLISYLERNPGELNEMATTKGIRLLASQRDNTYSHSLIDAENSRLAKLAGHPGEVMAQAVSAASRITEMTDQITAGEGVVHVVPFEAAATEYGDPLASVDNLLDALNGVEGYDPAQTKKLRELAVASNKAKISETTAKLWDGELRDAVEHVVSLAEQDKTNSRNLRDAIGNMPTILKNFANALAEGHREEAARINSSYGIWNTLDGIVYEINRYIATTDSHQAELHELNTISDATETMAEAIRRNEYDRSNNVVAQEVLAVIAEADGDIDQALALCVDRLSKIPHWREKRNVLEDTLSVMQRGSLLKVETSDKLKKAVKDIKDMLAENQYGRHHPDHMTRVSQLLYQIEQDLGWSTLYAQKVKDIAVTKP